VLGCAESAPIDNAVLVGEARIRVMAANTTSGNGGYDAGHGIRIFQGVDPDVTLVQELSYDDGPRAFVDDAFGTSFDFVVGTGNIPNAIVSRYPILARGEWDDPQVSDRGFVWARIDVPGPIDLWAVSVHLLTTSSGARDVEARALRSRIQASVPANAWLTIGGDFNANSRNEAAIRTLASVVDTTGPYPADRNGNTNTNAARAKPYDWLLANAALDARQVPTVIGTSTFPNGLVADTRVFTPISALAPARTSDSGASGMQHMAIVRDFAVIDDEEPPPPPPPPDGPSGDGHIILNEILANELGSDPAGEFIELVNAGTASMNLSGFTLADAAQLRHTFPANTILPAGARLVITAPAASTHALGLSNSGDTVTLADADGNVVDSVTFGSAADGVSFNRAPDITGTIWALHTTLSSAASSPNTAP
jgi:endonuclease/exonuclease/phosphatase family metal-dependent hydrolase